MRMHRGHERPHFMCVTESGCDGLDEAGVGHVCVCGRKCCSIVTVNASGRRVEVCVCTSCDTTACGLHRT